MRPGVRLKWSAKQERESKGNESKGCKVERVREVNITQEE